MKTINQFLSELEEELIYLNPKDLSEVLKHYRDKINIQIDYGESEEKIVASFLSPKQIAKDIYQSKGTKYLDKRKKAIKRNNIIKTIFYIILLIIIFIGTITLLSFMGLCIYKLSQLLIKTFSLELLLDKLSLLLFVIFYILILLIATIYIFDLLYIIFTHFVYPVLLELAKNKKEYKFLSFTLSDYIETKAKKKFLVKTLIILIFGLVVFGATNLLTKGYMYRLQNNQTNLSQNLKIPGIFNDIVIEESTTFVKIIASNTNQVTIKYYNEFNQQLDYIVDNQKLIIKPIKRQTFDFLGFLDEPLSKLEIEIPLTMNINNIDVNLKDGYFDINNIDKKLNFYLRGTNSTFALTKNNIDNLFIEGINLNLALENNQLNSVEVNMNGGKYYSVSDTYQNIEINAKLLNLILQKTTSSLIKIQNNSSKTVLDQVSANTLEFSDTNSESILQDISTNTSVITTIANSDTKLERFIATSTLNIEQKASSLKMNFVKSPQVFCKLDRGSLQMYYFNRNTIYNPKETEDIYQAYNNYNQYTTPSQFQVITNDTKATINYSTINDFQGKISFGTLDINDSNFEKGNVEVNDATVQLIDLDGTTLNVVANGGIFSYDLENIKTENKVYVSGDYVKTQVYINDQIDYEMEK